MLLYNLLQKQTSTNGLNGKFDFKILPDGSPDQHQNSYEYTVNVNQIMKWAWSFQSSWAVDRIVQTWKISIHLKPALIN